MSLRIITDSASDLPKEIIDRYDLHVIPTPVVIDGVDYLDGKTIFPEEFYDVLERVKDIKTYHINSYMFREHFEPYAKNKEEVLYICFSTGIAGTYNAANIAKNELLEEYPDFDLTIVDSKCASMGFGLLVMKLLKMQEGGAPKEILVEAANYFGTHMEHIFTVDTLEYLHRGGRLSKTSAVVGGILDIKPIIEVDDKGALVAIEKVRGRSKSIKRCVEIVGERGQNLESQTIGICHGNDPVMSAHVRKLLEEKYHCKDVIEAQVGCAIGAHTGPGIMGIIFLNATEEPYLSYLTEK